MQPTVCVAAGDVCGIKRPFCCFTFLAISSHDVLDGYSHSVDAKIRRGLASVAMRFRSSLSDGQLFTRL